MPHRNHTSAITALFVALSLPAAAGATPSLSPRASAPSTTKDTAPRIAREAPPWRSKLAAGKRGSVGSEGVDPCQVVVPITCGETLSGELTTSDCVLPFDGSRLDFYTFEAEVGDAVTIDLNSSEFDTYLFLDYLALDPSEDISLDNDDRTENPGSFDSRITHTIEAAGTWYISANNYDPAELGSYTVSLDCSPLTPPAAPSDLTATAVSSTAIDLIWTDHADNEEGFEVEARTGAQPFEFLGELDANLLDGAGILGLDPDTTYTFRMRAVNGSGASAYSNEASATTLPGAGTCTPSATTLCLRQGRFRVTSTWRDFMGATGVGRAVAFNQETGYFWFFSEQNIELLIKVLDACGLPGFNNFWVFAGGLTNVEVDITVTDTHTGTTETYHNDLQSAFQPIQDTSHFRTCP